MKRAALLRASLRVERALLNWLLSWAFLVTLAALLFPADAMARTLALTAFLLFLPVVLAVRHQVNRLLSTLPGLVRRERVGLLQIGDGEGVSGDHGSRHRLVHARKLTAAECLELPNSKVRDFIAQALSADASRFLVTAGRGDPPKIDNLIPRFRDQPKPLTFILDGASRSLSVRRIEGEVGGVTSPAAHDFGNVYQRASVAVEHATALVLVGRVDRELKPCVPTIDAVFEPHPCMDERLEPCVPARHHT
jgi:hypothetical protein